MENALSNITNILVKILTYVGVSSPMLLFFGSIFLLRNKANLLSYYIFGLLVNSSINYLLKGLIRQPRPREDLHVFHTEGKDSQNKKRYGFDRYGFPSGHAQIAFYSLGFLSSALKREKHFLPILFLFIFIACVTLYQRFAYKNHTIIQLIAGSLIGFFIGYLVYWIAERKIAGPMKRKKDDDAFAALYA